MKKIFALGFFDGVHLGHQQLLSACIRLAKQHGYEAGVATFLGHPDTLVKGVTPTLINTLEDRKRLLGSYGIDRVVELPFDETLMTMNWRDYIRMLRSVYQGAGFVCGSDFRFGYRGEGTVEILQNYCHAAGMPCAIVPEQQLDGITVSSTHIRTLLEEGRLEEANRFLGHPHILSGTVVSGRKLGRTIGVPTANLRLPEDTVKLPHGVYAGKAVVEGREYLAVTNIGSRPTVGGHHVTVEAWLLDFAGDLYEKFVILEFHKFLRPEKRFDSLEELRREIEKNAAQTRKFFEKT